LIQSERGDEPAMQGTAQSVMILRGVVQAVIMLALSGPIAALFGVREAQWAFAVSALVPFIRGFAHLDYVRARRSMRFLPATLTELVPQLAATAAVAPMARWFGNYAAIVWLTIGQAVIFAVLTHVLAGRTYRLSLEKQSLRALTSFATPLLLNGV